jgi:prepilin-type N-terminal cleavage/methylation domain-containing protein
MSKLYSNLGFTLVEVLITISILAMVGTVGIPGYRRFNGIQQVYKSSAELTRSLKAIQTKSQSQIQCSDGLPSLGFVLKFTSASTYTLITKCLKTDATIRDDSITQSFAKGTISAVNTNLSSCTIATVNGLSIYFTNPSTNPSLILTNPIQNSQIHFVHTDTNNACLSASAVTQLQLTLSDVGLGVSKTITINRGGAIYVQ